MDGDLSYETVTKYSGLSQLFTRAGSRGNELMSDEEIAVVRNQLYKCVNGQEGHFVSDGTMDAMGRPGLVLRKDLKKDVTGNVGMTSGVGLQGVPIVMPAQVLVPFPTVLRNTVPRRVTGGRTATWRQLVTPPVSSWPSVPEANGSSISGRGANIIYNEANTTVTYASIARETFLTPEAMFGGNSNITPGQDFNVAEVNRLFLLMNTYLADEAVMLGGNVSDIGNVTGIALAATQPTASAGSLSAATHYDVQITALTMEGYGSAFGNTVLATGRTGGVNSQGETGAAAASDLTTQASGAGSTALAVTWTPVRGAVAYNAYLGATGTGGKYIATTTTCSYTFTALGSSTHTVNNADETDNANDANGLIQLCTASTAGYYHDNLAAALTSDGTTNVSQYKTAFKYFYDNYRLAPDTIYESSQVMTEADEIILGSTTPSFYRTVSGGEGQMVQTGGLFAGDVLNPYGRSLGKPIVKRVLHPLLPAGMALFVTNTLGSMYPNANIGANLQRLMGWDYRIDQFAKTQRTISQEGIDLNGAMVVYAQFGLGAIVNIG